MRHNIQIAAAVITTLLTLQGCRQEIGNSPALCGCGQKTQQMAETTAVIQDTTGHMTECQSDVRRPDVKVRVGKGCAFMLATDGLALTAVDTAVVHAGEYSVTSLMDEELPPLPQGMRNMTSATAGYRLLPGGEHFSPYAELRVAYDPGRLPPGYTPDDIYTSYYDTAAFAWVRLKRLQVDTANREIVSATTHFTDFINELLQAPEMPETQAFVPTEISGLEAANPLAGYATIAPPEPNNMGTASLSYPFHIPTGRGGTQPNLALAYNSNGGNGLCGMGWDVSVPCISVETRWGVPLYSDSHETETYLLNGEQLLVEYDSMPTFARRYSERETNKYTKRFYPRVEGAFDSILRHGTTPQTYWWEVFDRSGTQYIYGLGDGELRSQQKNAVAKWYLTRVVDRNGNAIRYHYTEYKSGGNGKESGTALYLSKITYTSSQKGFSDRPWYGYCLTLDYENRNDPVVSGNLGVKENICKRLNSVKVWYVKNRRTEILHDFVLPAAYEKEKDVFPNETGVHPMNDKCDEFATRLLDSDYVVQTDSSLIRGYRLLYSTSETGKSLLSAVVEMSPSEWESHAATVKQEDLTEESIYKYHKFGYRQKDTLFSNPIELESENGDATGFLFRLATSPLGESCDKRIGGGISVGVGFGFETWLRTLNLECSGEWSYSCNDALVTLVDLNGDGYPDKMRKIILSSDQWKYWLFNPHTGRFGNPDAIHLPTKKISHTGTSTQNYGGGVHAGLDDNAATVNLGYQHSHSDAKTETYFVDVNADGLVDIVHDSCIFYNTTTDNIVSFSSAHSQYAVPHAMSCENGYYSLDSSVSVDWSLSNAGNISETFVSGYTGAPGKTELSNSVNSDTLKRLYTDSVKHSIVKSWIAPYDGDITVSGRAVLDRRLARYRDMYNSDGVRISIQWNNLQVDSAYLSNTDSAFSFNFTIDNVHQGDRLYFRVESMEDSRYDVVNWNPEINYKNIPVLEHDTEGRTRRKFMSSQDFMSWQDEHFAMPSDGVVRVIAPVSLNGMFSDTISVSLLMVDRHGVVADTLMHRVIAPLDTITYIEYDDYVPMREGNGLLFKAECSHDVDWTKLNWTPHILSQSFINPDIPVISIVEHGDSLENDTVYSIDVWPSPRYRTFFMHTMPRSHIVNGPVKVTLTGAALSHLAGRKAYLVERKSASVDVLDSIVIGAWGNSQLRIPSNEYNNLEVYVSGRMPNAGIGDIHAILPDNSLVGLFFDTVCSVANGGAETSVFGKMCRGWGHFVYNDTAVGHAISESSVKKDRRYGLSYVDSMVTDAVDAIQLQTDTLDPEGMLAAMTSGFPCPETDKASELTSLPVGEGHRIWSSSTGGMYVAPYVFSLTNFQEVQWSAGEDGSTPSTGYGGTTMNEATPPYIMKNAEQNGNNIYISVNFDNVQHDDSIGASAGLNYSFGNHSLRSDYMDFNGDGYPDAVFENSVQYTNSRGGMSSLVRGNVPQGEGGIYHTKYNAFSLQAGAAVPLYKIIGKSKGSISVDKRSRSNAGENIAYSTDSVTMVWMDINGDGLPDRITEDGVNMNLGYDYYSLEELSNYQLQKNSSVNSTTSAGALGIIENLFKLPNISFSAGLGYSISNNTSKLLYADINGDGLADKIENGKRVYYNNGWGFSDSAVSLGNGNVSRSLSQNIDVNGNITLGATLWGAKIQTTPNASIGYNSNSTEVALMDMNADGLPDIVSHDLNNIRVSYNQLYDVDKLVSVQSFYGNHIDVCYGQAPYSEGSRHRPTVMGQLTVQDSTGFSKDIRVHHYGYTEYVHSTAERTPFGFGNVTDTQYVDGTPYRITVRQYHTDSYKFKGRMTSETTKDADGNPYVKRGWEYRLKQIADGQEVHQDSVDCFDATWPALDSTYTLYYNPSTREIMVVTAERYVHADSGHVKEYINYNNTAVLSDDVHCSVLYTRRAKNQSALPYRMVVTDADNVILRHRSASYFNNGMLSSLVMHNGSDSSSVSNFYYDTLGNPVSFKTPPNGNGQRTEYQYLYDTLLHMFRTTTIDRAFGDTSCTDYDVRLGLPIRIFSIGGDSISYTYDDWGRPMSVRAPRESDTGAYPTIRYLYWDGGQPSPQINQTGFRSFTRVPAVAGRLTQPSCNHYHGWPVWAQTMHRSKDDPDLDMTTVLFADGHGRVLQTRKTAVVGEQTIQVASGHVVFDDAGRAIETYEPFECPSSAYCEYVTPDHSGIVSLTDYDILDRTVGTEISPLNISTSIKYGFDSISGVNHFKNTTTDPENRTSSIFADSRGLTVRSVDAMGGITRFEYDALGQLLVSVDPDGVPTQYGYTMTGQLAYRSHPDAGVYYYDYDPVGHLTKETNPLGQISYFYNHHRLTDKRYSSLGANDVHYSYGSSGRNKGKATEITDGSGVQRFEYDEMGRVSRSVRVMSVPGSANAYVFNHSFLYDSWNRMMEMSYPDGEKVSYRYNKAGDLFGMYGVKAGDPRQYIRHITYNKYGQQESVSYGNGTHTEYSYDMLQRLNILHSEDGNHNVMQNLSYKYDNVGNITLIGNNVPAISGMGGIYSNLYTYDSLNRLIEGHGTGVVGGQPRRFDIDAMTYSSSGRLGHKYQEWKSVTTNGTQQKMDYGYPNSNQRPHAPRRIAVNAAGDEGISDLIWDEAGNLVRVAVQGIFNPGFSTRFMYWTEDNRLFSVADDRYFSYYTYDCSGERTVKMTGDVTILDQNASRQHIFSALQNVTVYPSPYIVFSNHGYTKHYYAGAERVCARVGSGGLNNDTVCITTDDSVTIRTERLFSSTNTIINKFVVNEKDTADIVDIYGKTLQEPCEFYPGKSPVSFNAELRPDGRDLHMVIENLSRDDNPLYPHEPDVYFYHSDHLGSASWITDADGRPVQHLQYLPFGQSFVNQHTTGYQERYTFTGKEKDEETGYGYFGARYMDYELMTSWLSVDPLADKYPNISPYAYCAWNPIMFVDPNGKEKVISLSNSTKDNRIAVAADLAEDNEHVIHLWAHGLPNKILTYNQNCIPQEISSWRDMGRFLQEESFLYKNKTKDEILILVMHSCLTGQGDNNIAKEISSGLNLLVVAPTETIQVQTYNEGFSDEYSEEIGTMKVDVNDKPEKLGVWNVYYKGVLVETLNQSVSPQFYDPQSTIKKYEEIYQQKMAQE